MKKNLIITLINLSNYEKTTEKVIAKKEKNKITYNLDNTNYIIKILSPYKLILNRNNKNIECTMYFELNKTNPSIYTLKEEGYNIEINIKTTELNITEESIIIRYNVIDSNEDYEYHIEMSENNEH